MRFVAIAILASLVSCTDGNPMSDWTQSEESIVVRTDFTDDATWAQVKAAIVQPDPKEGFEAIVEFEDDTKNDGMAVNRLLELFPEGSNHTFIFLVDNKTISDADHPVLCVDLIDEPGRTFRVIPSQMWCVENNLAIANMDFEEFANNTDDDGVFRGFRE